MKQLKNVIIYSATAGFFLATGFLLAIMVLPQVTGLSVAAIDDASTPSVQSNPILLEQEAVYNQIYDNVAPSVVAISIQGRRGQNAQWVPISSGSGFVVDEQGHIVTNHHVVAPVEQIEQIVGENAEARIEIAMFDGTIAEAQIVGTDPDSDIAVIKIDVPQDRLRVIGFANSSELEEGQIVFAVGNPFSNDWTLTTGVISALNRSIPGLDRFNTGGVIQTDAAINPGNSGGPLVNLNGQVIGVNSQINTESGSNSGIGFAVPSNLVIRVANSIIETGDVQYSYLGITSGDIGLSLIEAFNLPDNIRGVPVSQVFPNTPASQAGLQSINNNGVDIITAIDGTPVHDFDELIGYLGINTEPGDSVIITVYRNGQVLQLPLNLVARPQ